jgi:DNA (cytosine-5)-methyltransferase 1
METRPTVIDLFCGAGGMSLGFQQAGFDIIAGVDSDQIHINTYHLNFPTAQAICADVKNLIGPKLRKLASIGSRVINVVIGGPPCQGFSEIGKRETDDPRNELIDHFGRLVDELAAEYFVLENVEGILKNGRHRLASFLWRMRHRGYRVVCPIRVLDAADHGVPQRRRRIFLLGYRNGILKPCYPSACPGKYRPTVWDAIRDLKDVGEYNKNEWRGKIGEPSQYSAMLRGNHDGNGSASITGCSRTRHGPTVIARFTATKSGVRESISKYHRLNKNGVSVTLRAGTGRERGSFTAPRPIHPTQPRCITVREAARLQSFPDSFEFHHTIWHGFRQIGNSVPPLLAYAVAKELRDTVSAAFPGDSQVSCGQMKPLRRSGIKGDTP